MFAENFQIITGLLTLAALIFAVIQIFQSTKLNKELIEQSSGLERISNSLSTRYLGKFPNYSSNLLEVINSATDSVVILTAMPTPEFFSNPASWEDYMITLRRNSREKEVTIFCPSDEERCSWMKNRFGPDQIDWNDFKKKNDDNLSDFVRTYFSDRESSQEEMNSETFFDLMCEVHRELVATEVRLSHAKYKFIDSPVTLGFCIADKKEAVFYVKSGSGDVSHGFYTNETRLISSFHQLVSHY